MSFVLEIKHLQSILPPILKQLQDLEIYNTSFDLAIRIRKLSLQLPHYDKFEVGTQIRRSSQSVKDNIVEGYGRRRYKSDFIKFLIYSYSSLLEAKSQAEFLFVARNESKWNDIPERYTTRQQRQPRQPPQPQFPPSLLNSQLPQLSQTQIP